MSRIIKRAVKTLLYNIALPFLETPKTENEKNFLSSSSNFDFEGNQFLILECRICSKKITGEYNMCDDCISDFNIKKTSEYIKHLKNDNIKKENQILVIIYSEPDHFELLFDHIMRKTNVNMKKMDYMTIKILEFFDGNLCNCDNKNEEKKIWVCNSLDIDWTLSFYFKCIRSGFDPENVIVVYVNNINELDEENQNNIIYEEFINKFCNFTISSSKLLSYDALTQYNYEDEEYLSNSSINNLAKHLLKLTNQKEEDQ